MKSIHVAGRRKKAVARATLHEGTGKIRINGNLLDNLRPEMLRLRILEPVKLLGQQKLPFDISISVYGGGVTSQAEACRLALARVLVRQNKKLENQFIQYDRSLLVADVRNKETHKPNCHGKARAKRQKSYR
jgi:small subunit ribosomal protein S9